MGNDKRMFPSILFFFLHSVIFLQLVFYSSDFSLPYFVCVGQNGSCSYTKQSICQKGSHGGSVTDIFRSQFHIGQRKNAYSGKENIFLG